ncbi:MAG: VCBS repeat-containing protein [Planctomycetota bacterium]|nr:VCBS repeat-containing protein [Planctomycetota bacterium]
MKHVTLVPVLLCALLICPARMCGETGDSVTVIDLEGTVNRIDTFDIDRDGKHEVVVQTGAELVAMSLADTSAGSKPKVVGRTVLKPDVFLYDVVDLTGKGRCEILAVTSESAIVLPFISPGSAPEEGSAVLAKLESPPFTGTLSKGAVPIRSRLAADIDGDGIPELILPHCDGWRIFRRDSDDKYTAGGVLSVRPASVMSVGWGLHGEIYCRSTLPTLFDGDFNGDRRRDFAAISAGQLLVFAQGAGGSFASEPSQEIALSPLKSTADAEKAGWIFGPAAAPFVSDLTGDGLDDIVIVFPYDGSVAVHIGREDATFNATPDHLLRVDGWIARAWLHCPARDTASANTAQVSTLLIGVSPKLGFWTGVQVAADKQVAVRLESHAIGKGVAFSDVAWQRSILVGVEMSVVHWIKEIKLAAAVGVDADFDGDAISDLLVKSAADEFELFKGNGNGGYSEEPVRRLPTGALKGMVFSKENRPHIADLDGDGRAEAVLLATEPRKNRSALCVVRFGE